MFMYACDVCSTIVHGYSQCVIVCIVFVRYNVCTCMHTMRYRVKYYSTWLFTVRYCVYCVCEVHCMFMYAYDVCSTIVHGYSQCVIVCIVCVRYSVCSCMHAMRYRVKCNSTCVFTVRYCVYCVCEVQCMFMYVYDAIPCKIL